MFENGSYPSDLALQLITARNPGAMRSGDAPGECHFSVIARALLATVGKQAKAAG
jgi:hypothetical protein